MYFDRQAFVLVEAIENTIELMAARAQEKHLDLDYFG
jgi:hypothetical protein